MEILIQHCSECTEYAQVIIDGQIAIQGDYYHDNIYPRIEGFVSGLKYCGKEVEEKEENFVCEYCK